MIVSLTSAIEWHKVNHLVEGTLELWQVVAERLLKLNDGCKPLCSVVAIIALFKTLPINSNELIIFFIFHVTSAHLINEERQVEVEAVCIMLQIDCAHALHGFENR